MYKERAIKSNPCTAAFNDLLCLIKHIKPIKQYSSATRERIALDLTTSEANSACCMIHIRFMLGFLFGPEDESDVWH
jgi:hypothetical protein